MKFSSLSKAERVLGRIAVAVSDTERYSSAGNCSAAQESAALAEERLLQLEKLADVVTALGRFVSVQQFKAIARQIIDGPIS